MEVIDQIRQSANIIEMAALYTTLRKSGRRHVGLCPFHSEKTPSFFVDEDKQLYHCFGCGAGGDIFTLVMEKEKLEFPEAVRYLAEKYNIRIPEKKSFSPQYKSLKEKIVKITEDTLAFYRKNLLNTAEGKKALAYLEKRMVKPEIIQTLKIGYAMNSWDSLLGFFRRKNVSPALLEKAGLVLQRQNREGFYDRFRGRLIFPIFDDRTGKPIAFGGRSLFDEEPKYLNSPDTPIYSKGNLLYGLNFSRDAIREKDEMILVEGYTDFLSLMQVGITNVAASLGTSLTAQQIDLARRRYSANIVACFDGDFAGAKAAYRAVSLCFEQGAHIRVVRLAEGMDPDGFIRKHGPEAFKAAAEQSSTGLKFLIDYHARDRRSLTPEDKARIAREVYNEIKKIPDAIIKSEYLKKTSEYLDLDEQELRHAFTEKSGAMDKVRVDYFLEAEKRLLQIIFSDSTLAGRIFEDIQETEYSGLKSAPIFELLANFFRHGKEPDFHRIKENLDPPLFSSLSEVLLEESHPPSPEETKECLTALRQYALTQKLKALKSRITTLKNRGDEAEIPSILSEIMDINRHLYELSQRKYEADTYN